MLIYSHAKDSKGKKTLSESYHSIIDAENDVFRVRRSFESEAGQKDVDAVVECMAATGGTTFSFLEHNMTI
jgi:hypothetical protein